VQAAGRYDPSRGAQFSTFAYYRVRGAIIDGIRGMAYLPRRAHQKLKAAEAQDAITEPVGEARAAHPETRGDAGATLAAIDDTLGRLTASYLMSAVGQGDDDAPDTPEELILGAETTARIRTAVGKLPDRERALVQGFYLEGRTFEDVAKELGISKSWASRLHTKALDLLRQALEE